MFRNQEKTHIWGYFLIDSGIFFVVSLSCVFFPIDMLIYVRFL